MTCYREKGPVGEDGSMHLSQFIMSNFPFTNIAIYIYNSEWLLCLHQHKHSGLHVHVQCTQYITPYIQVHMCISNKQKVQVVPFLIILLL